jgi:hypothetical protein
MRNLKKILALVLAMIMVVSMMVTASATAFVDDADIDAKYAEAVSVLSGIGVIRGVENADGSFSFQPKGNLNRAQAATIIAYVMRGTLDTIADEVSVYENPFTDVAEWAVPYVLFAHSNGIIVGRNETTYDPNATITGYELGKMLLIAGGFCTNANFVTNVFVTDGKAYTNYADALAASLNAGGTTITTKSVAFSDWQVRVATALKNNGIWDSEFALSKKLTREEACYLAFNTVIASTLDTTVFGLSSKADVDEFGRTTKVWSSTKEALKTMKITLDDHAAPAVFVATDSKTANAAGINALLGLKDKAALADAESVAVYVNGAVDASGIKIGDTVEYYVDAAGKVAKIVIIRETLETASVATEAEKSGDNKGLYKWTFGTAVKYAAKDAYTKDAYYLVVANGTKVLDINVPTVISKAKITKSDVADIATATAGKYVYVNNEKLTIGNNPSILSGATFGKEYDYVLNSNGYLIKIAAHVDAPVEGPELETGYAYLLGAQKQITTTAAGSSLIGGTTAYSWDVVAVAKLAMADGTFAIVDLTTEVTKNTTTGYVETLKINGGEATTDVDKDLAPVDILTDIAGNWVKYTIQEDGTYTLAKVNFDSKNQVTLEKDIADITGGRFATNSTVWTHYEINPQTYTVTTTVKVGMGKFPVDASYNGTTYNNALVEFVKDSDTVVKSIVTFDTTAPAPANVVKNAYYKGAGEYTANGQTYSFYVNGTLTNYFVKGADVSGLTNAFYNLTLDKDGNISKIEAVADKACGIVDYVDGDIVIIDGNVYYFYRTNTYNVSDKHTGETDTVAVGDTITFVYEDYYGKLELSVVYITKEAE